MDNPKTLIELGTKYGTDKGKEGHGYVFSYEQYLFPFKDKPLKIFEIGVRTGNSVKMWEEYFTNATIFGLDCEPKCKEYETRRIKILTGYQENMPYIKAQGAAIGKIDIIVDDGSHKHSDICASLEMLSPFLAVGGFYFIEDIDPNQGKEVVKTYILGLLQKDKGLEFLKYVKSLKNTGEELGVLRRKHEYT